MPLSQSKLGFHYYPDSQHFTQKDLDYWRPMLVDLGAAWLTLQASADRAVPEFFVRGLVERGIQPVITIPVPVGAARAAALAPVFRSYARWGVEHVVVYDRPNLQQSWPAGDWSRAGLVERFLDHALPHLKAQADAGLTPVFPALEPGGDYWDTAFLSASLKGILRRGEQALLKQMVLGAYAWTNGRPLDWGAGGPTRWSEVRPYRTPDGAQDQRGFRTFEWYAQVANTSVGIHPRILVVAGGARRPTNPSAEDTRKHTEQNLGIIRLLNEDPACRSLLLNFAFFALASDGDPEEQASAWFPNLQAPLPVVSAFKTRDAAAPSKVMPQPEKVLKHVVLLPNDRKVARDLWSKAADFALARSNALVGTAADAALQADEVTLVGDVEAFSTEFEEKLRSAGCRVQRMSFADPKMPAACGCSDASSVDEHDHSVGSGADHG
jgi:hypothetical protein